jgi:predicted nucleic acid-binding protein
MVILADTSAWIAYFRRTGSPANLRLRAALDGDGVTTTDMVQLEVLAGARDRRHLQSLRDLLAATIHLPIAAGLDAEQAADIYRTCQGQGETPRQLSDCLIAAVAIRNDVVVLHEDRDFEVIARHTPLQTLIA